MYLFPFDSINYHIHLFNHYLRIFHLTILCSHFTRSTLSIHPFIHSLIRTFFIHLSTIPFIHQPNTFSHLTSFTHPPLHPPIHSFIHPSTSSSTLLTTSCICFITSTYLPFYPLTQPPLYFHQPIHPSTISSTRQLNHPPTYSAIYPSTNLTIYPSTNLTIHPPPHLPIPPQSTTPRPEHTHHSVTSPGPFRICHFLQLSLHSVPQDITPLHTTLQLLIWFIYSTNCVSVVSSLPRTSNFFEIPDPDIFFL